MQHADSNSCDVQSPGLPHIDLEEMVGREMTCKVLEAIEENDRLVLSNRKSAFGQKKLSYNVRLCNLPQSPTTLAHEGRAFREGLPVSSGCACFVRAPRRISCAAQCAHRMEHALAIRQNIDVTGGVCL